MTATVGSKLGRCVRCMVACALGLAASVAAVLWIEAEHLVVLRGPVWGIAIAFGVLAMLHALAAIYRALTRLEEFAVESSGCSCGGARKVSRARRHGTRKRSSGRGGATSVFNVARLPVLLTRYIRLL